MSSLLGYYLLATGHNLAAVAARCLALDRLAHPKMSERLKTIFTPADRGKPEAWPSLELEWCRKYRKIARTSNSEQADLAEMISAIGRNSNWKKLQEARGVDYHRGRSPSAPMTGATITSAWTMGEGYRTMNWLRPAEEANQGVEFAELALDVEDLLLTYLPRIRTQLDKAMSATLT